MAQHIAFPSIGQFRNTIKSVRDNCDYHQKAYPTINFFGTVKLHGTNAGVALDPRTGEMWCQSRENIITVEKDNAGFAFFVESRKDYFKEALTILSRHADPDEIVVIFGEFAGGNIQKGVALSGLPKFFSVFAVYFAKDNEFKREVGMLQIFNNPDLNVYHSNMFPAWSIDIDFNNPAASSATLETITDNVEVECPVGKYFGNDYGVGEGIVWKSTDSNFPELLFKVKGEKHSVSKVKKGTGVASIAPEVQASIDEFVAYAVTTERLEQGIQRVFIEQGKTPDIKETGTFLKWVFSDICKEEVDVMVASGIEPKQVSGIIPQIARKWFMEYLDTQIMS